MSENSQTTDKMKSRDGKGDLSFYELERLSDIVHNVIHLYENYDAVRRQGKTESAKVMAARGQSTYVKPFMINFCSVCKPHKPL